MLQRTRESLALILLALLPFHALLVTAGTRIIAGPGHAPLSLLALWKEAFLGVVLFLVFVELAPRSAAWKRIFYFDVLDILILLFVFLAVVTTVFTHGDWRLAVLGARYDLAPLVAFLCARRVSWSEGFGERALTVLLFSAVIIVIYGLAAMVLPQSFFSVLGYSDLHSLYVPGGPIAAFQQIGGSGIRRMQSAMSGPNQLGIWLLLPFAVVLARDWWNARRWFIPFLILALLLTFSRAAWIGAACILFLFLRPRIFLYGARWHILSTVFVLSAVMLAGLVLFPQITLRFASSRDHIRRPIEAMRIMMEYPLGLGLGTAGPASNRVSDACVHLPAGANASWASDRSDLCVFAGDIQVQPADRACRCPLLPENWYLQIGVELGFLGLSLFLATVFLIMHALRLRAASSLQGGVLLAFVGVSIAALFLHAWEDSAIAYSLFLLAAQALPPRRVI